MTNSKATVYPAQVRQRPFAKMPLEWAPRWVHIRDRSYGLAYRLYALCLGTGGHPPRLEMDDGPEWALTCCRLLGVHPRDRRGATLALQDLRNKGLIIYEDGALRVLATQDEIDEARTPKPTRQRPDDDLIASRWRPDSVPIRSANTGNHSTPVAQIREEKIRSEEREPRAREGIPLSEIPEGPPDTPAPPSLPDPPPSADKDMWLDDAPPDDGPSPWRIGHDFLAGLGLWRPTHRRDWVEYLGARPEAERQRAKPVLQRDPWFRGAGTLRHLIDWWEQAYAKGLTPREVQQQLAQQRPGLASTAPGLEEVSTHKLETALAAQRAIAEKYPDSSAGRDAALLVVKLQAQLAQRKARSAA